MVLKYSMNKILNLTLRRVAYITLDIVLVQLFFVAKQVLILLLYVNKDGLITKQGQKAVHKNVSQGGNLMKRFEKRDLERDIERVREKERKKNEMESERERSAQFGVEASTFVTLNDR